MILFNKIGSPIKSTLIRKRFEAKDKLISIATTDSLLIVS